MRVARKRFAQWGRKTKQKLRYATIYGGYLKQYMRAFPKSPTILLFNKKHIYGWAFALCHNNTVSLSLFVNRWYRSMGLGTRLVEEALKDFSMVALARWNNETKSLFEKLQRKYPEKVIVYDFFKHREKYDRLVRVVLSR